ncbi:MAG: PilC/PilY family type IV pilus protein [Rhodanobacteraceae bacterium]
MARHAIRKQSFALTILTALALGAGGGLPTAAWATVDLANTPPDATIAVPPDLVVTFDDSGSMGSNYMSDNRPFDNGNWTSPGTAPWRCAGVIDDSNNKGGPLSSHPMNGVFYNPAINYLPPVNADGSNFPNADATLAAVQNDGVTANRPNSPSGGGSVQNFTGNWKCNIAGKRDAGNPVGGGPYYYRYTGAVLTTNPDGSPDPGSLGNIYTPGNWTAVAVPPGQYQNWANWWAYYHTRNEMARTSLSRVFGQLAANTSSGGYGSTLRAVWQNLNDGNFKLPGSAIISSLIDTASCTTGASTDPQATQRQGAVKVPPDCYRSAFFNWIFQIPANGSTPTRSALDRAGKFFKRGNGNTAATGNLEDPYWQPGTGGASDVELYCRKNFHVLITDGLWNIDGGLPSVASLVKPDASTTLPDGTAFPDPAINPVTALFAAKHDRSGAVSLSDLAFHYWASDLRPDLYDPTNGKFVPPYLPDQSTGVTPTGAISANTPHAAHVNEEIYFNPVDDPANWPHMAEYLIGLGVSGVLNISQDTDCTGGVGDQSDACNLRKGVINSTGVVGWPTPNGAGGGIAANIDDTWHAALTGRGQFFSAGNPSDLVQQLTTVLAGIIAASTSATSGSVNSGVLTNGSIAYFTGYDTDDWSGQVIAKQLDLNTGVPTAVLWDAGCLLTGGQCQATGTNVGAARAPGNRVIFTSDALSIGNGVSTGVTFQFASLSAVEQAALNTNPATGTPDGFGSDRLDFLRGDRSKENVAPDNFRKRNSVLGAVINSQATFVSFPDSGYNDDFPAGSPEATAAVGALPLACSDPVMNLGDGSAAACDGFSYEAFVFNHRKRPGTIYVGANDGMMHAFDASAGSGQENWAYVPYTVFDTLNTLTNPNFKFIPTVDSTPLERDVFFSDNKWHTELVGTLRLGGRGVYALDITNATTTETSANAKAKVLWEFNSTSPGADPVNPLTPDNPANLGYTFGQTNIGRLSNGEWVVLVPGGYFPDCTLPGAATPPCGAPQPAAASNTFSSLFVLDAQTGKLIKELRTSSNPEVPGIVSSGLARPVLGNYGTGELDAAAFAGDLQGNLWRFDLTDPNPGNWKVDLVYQPAVPGAQPITSMPRLFPDPVTQNFIVLFGTGKYLGASDNTVNAGGLQSIYGIRENGAGNAGNYYPAKLADLVQQDFASAGGALTELTSNPVPAKDGVGNLIKGWYFNLDVIVGERVVVTPAALFNTNRAIFITLIPGSDDPCDPSRHGTLLVVNAATGGPGGGLESLGGVPGVGYGIAGTAVGNVPAGGDLPLVSKLGGAQILIPGATLPNGAAFGIGDSFWRRRSWRVLDNN